MPAAGFRGTIALVVNNGENKHHMRTKHNTRCTRCSCVHDAGDSRCKLRVETLRLLAARFEDTDEETATEVAHTYATLRRCSFREALTDLHWLVAARDEEIPTLPAAGIPLKAKRS